MDQLILLSVSAGDHINNKLYIGICILAVIAILIILLIRKYLSNKRD